MPKHTGQEEIFIQETHHNSVQGDDDTSPVGKADVVGDEAGPGPRDKAPGAGQGGPQAVDETVGVHIIREPGNPGRENAQIRSGSAI